MANEKRLIDADALLETITKMAAEGFSAENVGRIIIAITDAKAVDAVPVVRCKDCKYCDPEWNHCDHPMSTSIPIPRKHDDFCSYGERR